MHLWLYALVVKVPFWQQLFENIVEKVRKNSQPAYSAYPELATMVYTLY